VSALCRHGGEKASKRTHSEGQTRHQDLYTGEASPSGTVRVGRCEPR